MSDVNRRISEVLRQPYSRVLTPELDGTFSAQITELPGCFSYGDTPADAYANLEEAARNWLRAALDQGLTIPEPLRPEEASGRFALRMPKSLHARLTRIAANEGASLNQFIVSALSERLGAETVAKAVRQDVVRFVHLVGQPGWSQRQATTTKAITLELDPMTPLQTSFAEGVLSADLSH